MNPCEKPLVADLSLGISKNLTSPVPAKSRIRIHADLTLMKKRGTIKTDLLADGYHR